MTTITRKEMIDELAKWGLNATNLGRMTDDGLAFLYFRYLPKVTDSVIDKAFDAMLAAEEKPCKT
jgi:N-acetyl-beta-hexosaminidase